MSLNEYIVIVPDFPNALKARLEVRPTHFSDLKQDVEDGRIVMGGASLSKSLQQGESPDMNGSILLVVMENEEAVRKRLDSDIYAKKGVWDTSKAQIIPFKCGVRTPM